MWLSLEPKISLQKNIDFKSNSTADEKQKKKTRIFM